MLARTYRTTPWLSALALGLAIGLTGPAWGQMPGSGPGGNGGPGAMGRGNGAAVSPGYGPGRGSGGWHRGRAGGGIHDVGLESLKAQLKITSAQEGAWKTYVEVVENARAAVLGSMRTLFRAHETQTMTPEQRLAVMGQMLALREQELTKMKEAADKLLPHLTDFQRGQASEILPGLAGGGFGMMGGGYGGGYGGGWGMMGGYGGEDGAEFMGPGFMGRGFMGPGYMGNGWGWSEEQGD